MKSISDFRFRILAATIALGLFASGERARAYPEFIAIGYKSCMTCHHGGTGGGGLSDYGRGLFAVEIAARPSWITKADDEKLSEYSSFLGSVQSPYWFKPGIKYRRLVLERNPGSSGAVKKDYTMQGDLNLAFFTSEAGDYGLVTTLAYAPNERASHPNRAIGESGIMAREYYLRIKTGESLWWSLGFFDKAFGIKHPDHTAVNRSDLKLGANDQTHGLMMHWQKDAHELFIQPFLGNVHLAGDLQSMGATMLYEYGLGEMTALGGSLKHEADKSQSLSTGALHVRMGLPGGHALMNELGVKNREIQGLEPTLGYYNYLEAHLHLVRGLFFQSILQTDKFDMKAGVPTSHRLSFGLMYFPMQRVELRLQAIQYRQSSDTQVSEDSWIANTQLHLSL